MDQEEIKYTVTSAKVDGKEYFLHEYKKPLNNEETTKLGDFLLKVEKGLGDEDGMDGVVQILKGWRKECDK